MKQAVETSEYVKMVRRVVRAAGRRVAAEDAEGLAGLVAIRAEVDRAIGDAITALRAEGFTWQTIGDVLGVTRQAALMRYGHEPARPVAD